MLGVLFIGRLGYGQITLEAPSTVCAGVPFNITVTSPDVIYFTLERKIGVGGNWGYFIDAATSQNGTSYTYTLPSFIFNTTSYRIIIRTDNNFNTISSTPSPPPIDVTLYQTPIIQSFTSNNICSSFPFSIEPSSSGNTIPPNTTYSWLTPSTAGGSLTGGTSGTNSSTISGTLINLTNTIKSATYTVTPRSAEGCPGANFTLTVPILPTPKILPQETTICSGGTFSVTINNNSPTQIVPAGTTYSWSAPTLTGSAGNLTGGTNGSGSIITGTLTNNTNSVQTATYSVTPTSADGCVGATFTVTVTVKPRPNIPSSNPPAICTGTSFVFTPTGIVPANTQYTWTVTDNPNVDGESNVLTPTASFTQQLTNRGINQEVVNYIVTPVSDGCEGPSFTSSVTLIANPQITSPIRGTVCSGSSFGFTPQNIRDGIVPANTSYTWTVVPNSNVTGQTDESTPQASITGFNLINTTLNEEDLIYNVTSSTSNGCATTTFQLIVKVVPVAQINNKNLVPICSGASLTVIPGPFYSDIVVPGTRYTWSFVDNPNVTGESGVFSPTTADRITQVLTNTSNTLQSVVYNVTSVANTCAAANFTIIANILPRPSITEKTTQTCTGDLFEVTPTNGGGNIVPVNTKYSWSAPVVTGGLTGGTSATAASTISGTLVNQTNSPQTATYIVTPISEDGCEGGTFTVTVTVNPRPSIQAKVPTAICSGDSFTVTPTNGSGDIVPVGTTYTWTVASNLNVTGQAASSVASVTSITQQLTNTTNQVQTVVYTVTPKSGDCEGGTFTVTVTVNPSPSIQAKVPTALCSGDSFTVTPTNGSGDIVPAGTTYTWTVATNLNVTGQAASSVASVTSITQQLTNTTNQVQTVVYTVTPKSGDCIGGTFTITVTVNPKATIASNTAAAVCSGFPFSFIPPNTDIVPLGTTYTWSNPSVTGGMTGGTSASNSATISGTLTNIVSATQTATYLITPLSGSCPGGNFTITVNINALPYSPTTVPVIVTYNKLFHAFNVTTTPSNASNEILRWYSSPGVFSTSSPTYNLASPTPYTVLVSSYNNLTQCESAQKATASLTINTKQIDAQASAVDKVYDRTTTATASVTSNELESGDLVNFAHGGANFDTYLVGTGKTVTLTGVNINGGANASNYTLKSSSNTLTTTASITSKPITVTATATDRVYNATTSATVTLSSPGVIVPDLVEFNYTQALFNNKTANVGKQVSVSGITISGGADAGNYTLTATTATTTGTISKSEITITGAVASNKVYNGTISATITGGTITSSVLLSDVVTLDLKGVFDNRNVGENKPVTSTSTIGGADAANYFLTQPTGLTATITKKHIVEINPVTQNKTYDATVKALNYTAALKTKQSVIGSDTDSTAYTIDDVSIVPTAEFATMNVGNSISISSTSTLAGADKGNYELVRSTLLFPRNISKKTLNMSGLIIPASKVYDGTRNAEISGEKSLLTASLPGEGTATDGKPYTIDNQLTFAGNVVGTYNTKDVLTANTVTFSNILLTGAGSGNYSLTIQQPTPATITPKELTMSGLSVPATKIYDANKNAVVTDNKTLQIKIAPGTGNKDDGKPYDPDVVSISGTAVGTYNSKDVVDAIRVDFTGLSLTGADASNYTLKIQAPSNAAIEPLIRNIVANQQNKIYGQDDPILTYTSDPLLESDTYTGELKRVVGKNVGSYPIEIGTLTAGSNYILNFTPNVLLIDKAIMFITAKNATRTYGDAPLETNANSIDFVADGMKYNETVGFVTVSYANGPGSGNAINDSVGTYAGAVNAVDVTGGTFNVMNYKTIFFRGDIIVKKLPIIVSAESKEKREGQQDPTLTYKISTPLVLDDQFTGRIIREPGEEIGAYQIQIGTLALSNNYDLTFRPAVFTINPEDPTFVLPTAFTPNGDGVNDVFKIIQDGISSINYFQIFSRSGRLVFQTKNLGEGWDGRVNGIVLDSDVYYWNVEFVTWNNKVRKVSGSVILIK